MLATLFSVLPMMKVVSSNPGSYKRYLAVGVFLYLLQGKFSFEDLKILCTF
jgi:hypothetical protein